jgi:hypothetical protein
MTSLETMYCLGCGYDLRGLPENRCPECGRAFDSGDPATYLGKRESGKTYLWTAIGAAPLAIVPTAIFRWISPGLDFAGVALIGVWGLGLLVELSVVVAGSILLVRPRHTSERRALIALAVLIAIAVILVCSGVMLKLCVTATQ